MKIQNNGSAGSAPLEAPRTQPLSPDAANGTGGKLASSGLDGDSIEISSMSAQVAQANAAEGQQRANRVAALEALHARGNYQVNATKLSGAMVSQALAPESGA